MPELKELEKKIEKPEKEPELRFCPLIPGICRKNCIFYIEGKGCWLRMSILAVEGK